MLFESCLYRAKYYFTITINILVLASASTIYDSYKHDAPPSSFVYKPQLRHLCTTYYVNEGVVVVLLSCL